MSWRDAPLYVEAFDLASWTMERTQQWPHGNLARLVTLSASELVISVSLALTFPANRGRHLEEADEGIVRLRTQLRLAHALGLLSRRGLRFSAGRLGVIGRMIGGWRKRLDKQGKEVTSRRVSGEGPRAAASA